MNFGTRMRALAAAIFATVALTAGWQSASAASAPGQLTIGIRQFPAKLHPKIDSLLAKTYVLGFVRRPLTTFNHELELVCMLCTELPSVSNGGAELIDRPGGKRGVKLRFSIQPDARWGDGIPITTKDVLFSWEVGRHPLSGIAVAEIYQKITRIDAVDDKTFVVEMDELRYDYNNLNDFEILPAHIERAAFNQPAEYKNRSMYETDPTHPGLYSGPYRITEISVGAYIVLERNAMWWGERPAFDKIIIRAIENTAALEANLLSGEIDMVPGELGFNVDQAASFEQRHGDKYKVLFEPSLFFGNIALNLDNTYLQDVRVRQALLHAIDRPTISEQLFSGYQPVASSFVHPFEWFYADDLPPLEFDVDAANKLLDEAGYTNMKDGIRHDASGNPLAFELMTTAGDRTRERIQQILQDQWRKVGVDVRIRNEPARVLLGETVVQRKFTAMALFEWVLSPETVPRSIFHSSEIPSAANNFSGENYMGFRDAETDRIIERLEVEIDSEKRRPLWHRLQEIYAEKLPSLPLYSGANMHVQPLWLDNARPTGHQMPSTLWVEEWTDNR